jgi:lysine 6-dehydrogenase
MVEKTLRYPGHIELTRVLRESGFLSKEAIDVHGMPVRPIDLTAALLFPQWRLEPGEAEFTAMRLNVRGEEAGEAVEYAYRLVDRFDAATGTTSMARTTGYTCAALARLVLNGQYLEPGIRAPEHVAASDGCFEQVLGDLAARGVVLECSRAAGSASQNSSLG